MLATANRTRITIRGQPCKNFPHIPFDHRANFCCLFLILCAHMQEVPKISGMLGPRPLEIRVYLTLTKHAPPPRVLSYTKFRRSRSNRLGVGRIPKFEGRQVPAPWEWGAAD